MDYGEATQRIRIWDLDCIELAVVLAKGVPMEILRDHAVSLVCSCCSDLAEDDAWVLQGAHRVCHEENWVSESLEAYLNRRYRREVYATRNANCLELARHLASGSGPLDNVAGVLWGLLTDQDRDKRLLGNRLVHALLLGGGGTSGSGMAPVQIGEVRVLDRDVRAKLN